MKRNSLSQAWLRFTDEGTEGVWRDKWTNQNKNFSSIPWRLASEPTGFIAENCTGLTNEDEEYHWAFDIDCEQKISSVCQDVRVYFRLRGLCSGSALDRLYRLIPALHNNRRTFYGPSGWKLGWESEEKLWKISNDRYPGKGSLHFKFLFYNFYIRLDSPLVTKPFFGTFVKKIISFPT